MVKKKGLKKFDISNKLAYTLMVVLSIALLGIGVYAWGGTNPPVMGHSLGEIQVPAGCLAGQVMKLAGGVWTCGVDDETDSRFWINGSGLCYNAPFTCDSEILSCSVIDFTYITSIDMPPSQTCFSLTSSQRATLCIAKCQEDLGMYPCDGRDSICGGTAITWGSSTTGICEVSDEIECHCRASGDYTKATYTAAGPRCI